RRRRANRSAAPSRSRSRPSRTPRRRGCARGNASLRPRVRGTRGPRGSRRCAGWRAACARGLRREWRGSAPGPLTQRRRRPSPTALGLRSQARARRSRRGPQQAQLCCEQLGIRPPSPVPAREVLLEQTERRRRAASLAAQRLRLAEGDLGHRDEAPGRAELARGEAVAAGLERRLAGAEAALGRRRVGLAVAGRALLELRQPVLGVGPPRGVARREVLLVERDRLLVVTAELTQGLRAVEDQLGELEQALGSREGIVG